MSDLAASKCAAPQPHSRLIVGGPSFFEWCFVERARHAVVGGPRERGSSSSAAKKACFGWPELASGAMRPHTGVDALNMRCALAASVHSMDASPCPPALGKAIE